MRLFAVSLFLSTLLSVTAFANGGNPYFGARSAGMSNASVSLKDLWSVRHNQAGLAFLKTGGLGFSYENRFLIEQLATKSLIGAFPLKFGTIGVNVSQFGYSKYNESKLGLAFAKKLSKNIALGVQVNYQYFQFGAGEYGQKGLMTGEIGFIADINEELTFAAHVFNPSNAKLASFNNERIPVVLRIGGDYKFSTKFLTTFEVEKDINTDPEMKLGAEFMAHKMVYLRAGISTNPFRNSFGLGVYYGKLKMDIAAGYHNTLGYSPQVSISYNFK